jgi:2-C-methyl-D-erythritol 4-phosphate cytidylyltransferase
MHSDVPKQYLPLAGRSLLEHSLKALLDNPDIASVVVALSPDDQRAASVDLLRDPRVRTTTGGDERADSVLAGLACLGAHADDGDWVLVHDAARPCLPAADLQRLIGAVQGNGVGGILAEPVVDTVKQASADGLVEATLDRDRLWRAQTPQMFRLGDLRSALRQSLARGDAVTDEASAMERAGFPVQLVRGSAANLKVTVAEDLALAAFYLQRRSDDGDSH